MEDENVKFGESGSTDGQNPIESSAASVRGGDGGINDAAGAVNIGRLVRHNHPRCNHSPTNLAALAFASAKEALSGDASGVRWIYECYLTSTDYTIRGGDGKKEVATILTADHTGPLLVSIWSPTLDEFKNIMKQYNPQDGQLMLRFEQLRFAPMPMSEWNGNFVTPMRVAHTLTPEPKSPMKKKQKTQATTASISLRDGT